MNSMMEKEVIGIFVGGSQYGSLNYFARELEYEFENRGFEVVFLDMLNLESLIEKLTNILDKNVKAIFGFNGMGIDLEISSGQRISELLNTRYYGFYVDHPLYHAGRHHYIRRNSSALS